MNKQKKKKKNKMFTSLDQACKKEKRTSWFKLIHSSVNNLVIEKNNIQFTQVNFYGRQFCFHHRARFFFHYYLSFFFLFSWTDKVRWGRLWSIFKESHSSCFIRKYTHVDFILYSELFMSNISTKKNKLPFSHFPTLSYP